MSCLCSLTECLDVRKAFGCLYASACGRLWSMGRTGGARYLLAANTAGHRIVQVFGFIGFTTQSQTAAAGLYTVCATKACRGPALGGLGDELGATAPDIHLLKMTCTCINPKNCGVKNGATIGYRSIVRTSSNGDTGAEECRPVPTAWPIGHPMLHLGRLCQRIRRYYKLSALQRGSGRGRSGRCDGHSLPTGFPEIALSGKPPCA